VEDEVLHGGGEVHFMVASEVVSCFCNDRNNRKVWKCKEIR
jgi:hypothetical protein